MNVLWFSWKDIKHPKAGGAEVVSDELRMRLANGGHSVRLITSHYPGSSQYENIKGTEVFRVGNRFTVYLKAWWLFRKEIKNWPDLIIDEMNTVPFGCVFYTRKRTVLLTYQLARQVWFYQIFFPLSLLGYILEPIYLLLLSQRYHHVLTESESTKRDLKKCHFKIEEINVFRVGMALAPLGNLLSKNDLTTVLSLGAFRPMKRTLDAVKGFEAARDLNMSLRLVMAGDMSGPYGDKVMKYVKYSRHSKAISVLGRVSDEQRLKLMREASVIVVTSIKEGWGLIVTEANSQGTPAIAYDVDGLRDSVIDGKTGMLVPSGDTQKLGDSISTLLADPESYDQLRQQAWEYSKQFTFNNSYNDFIRFLNLK